MIPGTHEGVLQNGKLVLIVAQFVQQSQNETLGDVAACHGNGPGNGRPQLVTRHARNKVESVVHGLWQSRKFQTIADEIRAHC